jgi:hypothetical protein
MPTSSSILDDSFWPCSGPAPFADSGPMNEEIVTEKKRVPTFVKVDALRPGTNGHNLTVKVPPMPLLGRHRRCRLPRDGMGYSVSRTADQPQTHGARDLLLARPRIWHPPAP